jgi:hypothetical protein
MKFKQTQKFRVVINGVSFYTTAKAIRDGVGDFTSVNLGIQQALAALENSKGGAGIADQCTVGIAGTWSQHQIQLNQH